MLIINQKIKRDEHERAAAGQAEMNAWRFNQSSQTAPGAIRRLQH
jgi:hypothetical protein